MNKKNIKTDMSCRLVFKKAYDNRYTWPEDFSGYKGKARLNIDGKSFSSDFKVDKNIKVIITGNIPDNKKNIIKANLFDVTIHRFKRPFDEVHKENIFNFGNQTNLGKEIILKGKSKGDRYIIKDNIIKSVYRTIHGILVEVITNEILQTNQGYLAIGYTSQYFDPISKEKTSPKTHYKDSFIDILKNGTFLLQSRSIKIENNNNDLVEVQELLFSDMKLIN
tara:strand:- start:5297 stop:5962 length:666 start_codon:yes stop_codon:yes gene_type:complete